MFYRPSRLVFLVVVTAILGCAGSNAAVERTGAGEGSKRLSRMSDLAVTPATRRLHPPTDWINSEIRPSPDGRYVSMTDWTTGDLALHDLAKDSTLRLTGKGSWDQSSDFAETSVISPDGKSIAYGWYVDSTLGFDIMVMPLSGADSGKARKIYRAGPMTFTGVQAWTPDGKNIVAVVEDTTLQIVTVPANAGPPVRLKTFTTGYPNNFSVSPDARWLAYDVQSDEAIGDRDVHLLALDGSSESVVSSEKGDDFVLGWTRDGTRLLYGSERGGTAGVWAVAITGGKPVGTPELVRSDMARMYPLGGTNGGRIIYGVNTGTSDLFLATMNPTTGELITRPAPLNSPIGTHATAFAWSTDGKQLASVVARSAAGGPSDIVIRSIDRGEVRRLSPRMRRILYLYWGSDGASLIVRGTQMKGKWGIYSVDLKTARMKTIAQSSEPGFGRSFSLSRDGKTGYFVSADSAFKKFSVTSIDLATHARKVMYTIDAPLAINGMAISPDGTQLGIAIRGGEYGNGIVALLPVTGGIPREIFRFSSSESIGSGFFAWSGQGKDLLFGVRQTSDSSGKRIDVRALSVSDGRLRSLGIPPARITGIRLSSDNRRLAFFVSDPASELWTMDEPVFSTSRTVEGRR
jgi:Tol biopolymer transport system component